VAVDPNGNATAVWAHGGNSDPDTESGIWSNRYTPITGWGTPVPVDGFDEEEAKALAVYRKKLDDAPRS